MANAVFEDFRGKGFAFVANWLQGVCLNVAGRDSRVEVACAGAGKGRGCGRGLGSRVNINHQIQH